MQTLLTQQRKVHLVNKDLVVEILRSEIAIDSRLVIANSRQKRLPVDWQ